MEAAAAEPLPAPLIARFAALVGQGAVISEPEQLRVYECDGLAAFRARPGLVVLPRSTEEVAAVVKLAREAGIPIVARGSGTGLSAGAMPIPGCIVLGLSRMKRIIEIDLDD